MKKINIIFVIFCVFISSQTIRSQELASLPQDDSEIDKPDNAQLPTPQIKKPNLVTIDLSECTCTGVSTCDFAILRSALVDLSCQDGESLCCPMTKSTTANSLPENKTDEEHPAEIAPKSNVRVYSITPTIIRDFHSPTLEAVLSKKSQKNKGKKCACKARSSCPHKNIDYGFGFHCTYNTVRCCTSEEDEAEQITISVDMENETVQDQLVLSSVNATMETDKIISDSGVIPAANTSTEALETNFNVTTAEMDSMLVGEEKGDMIMPAMTETEHYAIDSNSSSVPKLNIESNVPTAFIESPTTAGDDYGEEQERQEENAEAEGDLIITEVTNWSDLEDDYEKEAECFCLPIHKCRVAGSFDTNNMIERRRDTLCPGDLVQCCGRDVLDEITKKRDDVAGEYDAQTTTNSEMSEPAPQQASQYPSTLSSDSLPLSNESNMGTLPTTTYEVQNAPTSSIILPAPFPGYQPPGYYKGYGNQFPAKSYLSNGQQTINNQYYRNGQQQQQLSPQNQYDTIGGQSYRPWTYNNYAPSGQVQGVPYPQRNPYGETDSSSRHKSGGLFDTLSKYLG